MVIQKTENVSFESVLRATLSNKGNEKRDRPFTEWLVHNQAPWKDLGTLTQI